MDDTRGRIVTYYPNISDITVRHEGTSTVAEADFIDDQGKPSKGQFLILGAPLNPRVADLSFHPVQLPAYAIIRRQVSATLGCGDKPCE
ncbi:MAG: hypothetical protein KGO53_13105 [Alphaproteobacteria bacterium]|nr:hypothetical protein [Alphaproteobacteria bacterium]